LALYYLDTSALVKLYVREPGTDQVLRLAQRGAGHRLAILALSPVEFRSAVRKRQRLHDIDDSVANQIVARFGQHLETRYVCQMINNGLLDLAGALVDRHPLRAFDAIQLAGCLTLQRSSQEPEIFFVCADRDLLNSAEAEGLKVLDPTR
jgi:predicted nucleic acid-binding protein